jgi:hypothetical protein
MPTPHMVQIISALLKVYLCFELLSFVLERMNSDLGSVQSVVFHFIAVHGYLSPVEKVLDLVM